MSRFLARRHRRLMDESEQALQDASESRSEQKARISQRILSDSKTHRLWESQHARLLEPVAEHCKPSHQIVTLRLAATKLIHGRAFVEHIRDNEIRGTERERFFARYYRFVDYHNAVLSAHRDYMLSLSSMVSTDHLINVMYDPVSHRLLRRYSDTYRQYFDLTSVAAGTCDEYCATALQPIILATRRKLRGLKHALGKVPPHDRCREFERQACLAKSGRYPVLNYLVV